MKQRPNISIDVDTHARLLRIAKKRGLMSMSELLRAWTTLEDPEYLTEKNKKKK